MSSEILPEIDQKNAKYRLNGFESNKSKKYEHQDLLGDKGKLKNLIIWSFTDEFLMMGIV